MRFAALLLVGAALVLAPAETETPLGSEALDQVRAARRPPRDLADLRSRIHGPPVPAPASNRAMEGDLFWVLDFVQRSYRPAQVELRYASEHAEWFVEQGRDGGNLADAAAFFESRIFPRVTELTGVRWAPGHNGEPRLAIFHGSTPGVAGYVSAGDAHSKFVFPYSNERLIVYLSLDSVRPGSRGYNATLAHELEHLAHLLVNPAQEGWLDEGLAELVSNLVMDEPGPSASSFRARSNVQLTAWSEKPWEARAHYEASYLWVRYLMERGGGPAALPDLISAGGQGLLTAERFARARGLAGGSDALVRDWLLANVIADSTHVDGRFGYRGSGQRSATAGALTAGGVVEDSVHQFAANYYDLSVEGPTELRVEISPIVPLIASDDVRGAMFWSSRGDNIDTRLTRAFDLTGLDWATLQFRLWFDLEPDFDVCYALASADGTSWFALSGRWTTDDNRAGSLMAPGYTGRSGSTTGWLEEEVDLTSFAGGMAYIRFECVTDQGYSGPGFAVDQISIPELGFFDPADVDQGWHMEGFVRASNSMAQPAAVLLVEVGNAELSVRDVPLDSTGRGSLQLRPGSAKETVLVVAGLAPATLEKMSYRVWLATSNSSSPSPSAGWTLLPPLPFGRGLR